MFNDLLGNDMTAEVGASERPAAVRPHLLPPIAWMLIFLIGGYLLMRLVAE